MGLDVCLVGWLPELTRSHRDSPPSAKPAPRKAPPSGASGLPSWGLLPLSVGRNRINVCMNFRFPSVWCFGGQAGPQHTPLWPLSQGPGSRKTNYSLAQKPSLIPSGPMPPCPGDLCEIAQSLGRPCLPARPLLRVTLCLVQAGGVVSSPV